MNKLYTTKEIYSGWLYSLIYIDGICKTSSKKITNVKQFL